MGNKPYSFYNYKISNNSYILSARDQWSLLNDCLGKEVPYRKSTDSRAFYDTSIITPGRTSITTQKYNTLDVLFFSIARHIDTRKANKYDKINDKLAYTDVPTDEYIVGDIILLPHVHLLAASDRTTQEYLNASSTTRRFVSIVKFLKKYDIKILPASSKNYIKTALATWKINEFSFTARPFNPSVRTPGDRLHELLVQDNAKVVGKAKPNKGEQLIVSDEGWINEVTGLADRGYGEYGAVGTTEKGYFARIEKSAPESSKLPKIKVYIPEALSQEKHVQTVAETLLEIDG